MTSNVLRGGVAIGIIVGSLWASGTAQAEEPVIDLPRIMATPGLEVGWASTEDADFSRFGLGLNIHVKGANVYVEPRAVINGRHKSQSEDDAPKAIDRWAIDAFVGYAVSESGGSSDVGLQRVESSTTYSASNPRYDSTRRTWVRDVTSTTKTTIRDQRGYSGIPTLDQFIVEAGVVGGVAGTTPALTHVFFPAVGVRYHHHFDMKGKYKGKDDRIRRNIIYSLHLLGPRNALGEAVNDETREEEGYAIGAMATAEIHVFKTANWVFRGASMPKYASYAFSTGLRWPLWW